MAVLSATALLSSGAVINYKYVLLRAPRWEELKDNRVVRAPQLAAGVRILYMCVRICVRICVRYTVCGQYLRTHAKDIPLPDDDILYCIVYYTVYYTILYSMCTM